MVSFVFAVLLLLITAGAVSLLKVYRLHPLTELKRRARGHDKVAARLYPVAAYGPALRLLLWALLVLPLAGSFVLLTQVAPGILVYLFVSFILGYMAWLPPSRPSNGSVRLAIMSAPALLYVLKRLHGPLSKLHRMVTGRRRTHQHTKLYQHDDLLDLFDRQKHQSDSRIPPETLDMLAHMLTFGTKHVRECMVPRSRVKLVSAAELVSPVLLDELHASGHRRFPVYHGQPDQLVGTLDLNIVNDLKHTGSVQDAMEAHLYYLHEDHPLEQVIDAFYKTGAHMFMVVDGQGDFTGIVTMEDVLAQLLGYKIAGDFAQYDNLPAVAGYQSE